MVKVSLVDAVILLKLARAWNRTSYAPKIRPLVNKIEYDLDKTERAIYYRLQALEKSDLIEMRYGNSKRDLRLVAIEKDFLEMRHKFNVNEVRMRKYFPKMPRNLHRLIALQISANEVGIKITDIPLEYDLRS